MKKNVLFTFFVLSVAAVAFISSCKKDDDNGSNNNNNSSTGQLSSQTKQHNEDASYYKNETDQNNEDINSALNGTSMMRLPSGTNAPQSWIPCGATVDSSQISNKIIKFNFDGTTHCLLFPVRTRSGQIVVQLSNANHWNDSGAVLTVTLNNYKVTRVDNGKSITFNGTKTLINPNGFNWLYFYLGSETIFYKERVSNMQVTFDNSTTATWNSSRSVWWTHNLTTYVYTFRTVGDTAYGGFNNVSEWGTNRFNTNFITYYNSDLTSNTGCGLWRPNSGELVYNVVNSSNAVLGSWTFTLGVDQHGTLTPTVCPCWGFKVTWKDSSGNSQYTLLPYW